MANDKLTIEILADGTLKTTSDAVSAANHDNCENFIRNCAKLCGGAFKRVMRTDIPRNLLTRILREHSADGHTHSASDLDSHSH